MSNMQLEALAEGLTIMTSDEGLTMSAEVLTGDVDMVKVEVEDREEFPIFITVNHDQILCTTYLWREGEVSADKRTELLEAMLTMNLPMPLSPFGKVGDQYLIFGAMPINAGIKEVQHEVCALSDNTLNAIEAMQDYLQ